MLTTSIRFMSLFLTSLLVGAMFGIWMGFNPAALSPMAFVEMQQNAIRALNVSFPALGFVCIVLTAVLAFLTKNDARGRYLLVAAVLGLIAAGLITRFGNQPINAVVMTWSPQAPASNWTELRDTWWHLHVYRTIAAIAALALALLAAVGSPHRSSRAPLG
jgi:uncharacterized membrane protein